MRTKHNIVWAVVLLLALASSCVAPSGPLIAFVGNSITVGATDALTTEFTAAGWTLAFSANAGDHIADRIEPSVAVAARHPRVAIIELGTNDGVCLLEIAMGAGCEWRPGDTVAATEADLDQLLATFDATTCVIGVVPYWDYPMRDLWLRAAEQGRVRGVYDWARALVGHTTTAPEDQRWLADEIGHLLPAGDAAYAAALHQATDTMCPAGVAWNRPPVPAHAVVTRR